jgi:hypothetical protein
MDWILEHLQIVIAIAGAIAYWLNARNKEKAGEEADYDGDGVPDSPLRRKTEAPPLPPQRIDYDENMRRLREEIRRKVAERQGQAAGRALPEIPPVMPAAQDWRREQADARRAETERESAAVLERQKALADQLAALKTQRQEAAQAANAATWATQAVSLPGGGARTSDHDTEWLRELRNTRSLKKAIVLREVLGTPVGLQ